MEKVIHTLKKELKSEIRYDQVAKELYSTDASIYEVKPLAVLIPRSKSELVKAIEIAHQYAVPVIARGSATGIAGGCLGKGLVIDTSQHLNRVVEINYAERFAVVQPGVVLDRLNEMLAPHGLYFAPETSTSNRATIGGMVSTNAAGANSLKIGKIAQHVLEIELVLWNGEVVRFSSLDKEHWKEKLKVHGSEGKIYRSLERIRKEFGQDIREKFPKIKRRASGYSLDEMLNEESFNVSSLICGAEGTLGFISEIKIALSPIPKRPTLVVIGYKSMEAAFEASLEILPYAPSALELIDSKIIQAGKMSPSMRGKLEWLQSDPQALLAISFEPDEFATGTEKSKTLALLSSSNPSVLFCKTIEEPEVMKQVWDLRKSGLGLLMSKRSFSRAIAFIEDVSIPTERLAEFVNRLQQTLGMYGKDVGIYGHVGAGCLHIRPYIDLRRAEELGTMQNIMDAVANLVLEFGGVLSGEHGDGRVRSWTNPKMFGPRLYEAMTMLKQAFDPYGLMNPGKIVASQTETPQGLLQNLKLSPQTHIKEFSTYLDFSREGGLQLAVDLCNGNGQCRKKEGTMCPSYQVTHDERDSTRARANALRGIIFGELHEKDLYSDDFHKVMDLCLQCKGCKSECPSQVDMAKMKSEYLYHLHAKKKPSLRDRLFAHITDLFNIATKASGLVNLFNRLTPFRKLVQALGISAERSLPKLASKRFSRQFKNHLQTKQDQEARPQVILFVDSFTEFVSPWVGMATVRVLEDLKYNVIAPEWQCCGRPLISKGFLPQAKKKLEALLDTLYPYAKQGIPIVGVEPSCTLTLCDELRDFNLDQEKVEYVRKACQTIDQFLLSHTAALKELTVPFVGEVKVHGHCHQKSLIGMQAELAVLRTLVSGSVTEIPSGCCGMAGSFGYEAEHAQFSKKIGELVLFPAIRESSPDTAIIASGNSCRHQIEDGTEAHPLHFIEFIARQLKSAKTEALTQNIFHRSGFTPFSLTKN